MVKAAHTFAEVYAPIAPRRSPRSPTTFDVPTGVQRLPAEQWIHPRTTNPIESTFATVRPRQRVTEGPGSRAAGGAMAFELIESAQARWRAVNAPSPRWSEPAQDSRTANSSYDPTSQEVNSNRVTR
jgi:putative transposase